MSRSTVVWLLLLTASFFGVSCSKQQSKPVFDIPSEPQVFDSSQVAFNLSQYSPNNRLSLLEKIAQTDYLNMKTADRWLARHVEDFLDTDIKHSPEQLFNTLYALNQREFSETVQNTSKLILLKYQGGVEEQLFGLASLLRTEYFIQRQERDSARVYLNFLEDVIENDTSAYLKRGYYIVASSFADLEGDYFKAIVNNNMALEYIHPKDTFLLFTAHNNMASLYLNMNFYEKAAYHADLALNYVSIKNVPPYFYDVLAIIQSHAGNYSQAEELLTAAVTSFKGTNSALNLARTYSNLGNLRRRQQQFSAALLCFKKSDSIAHANGLMIGKLINSVNRAEVYLDMNNASQALTVLNAANDIRLQMNLPYINLEYFKLRYRVYDALGQQSNADRNYRLYKECEALHTGDYSRSIIAQWELATEKEKRAEERAAFTLSLQQETQKKYIIGIVVLILGIVWLVVFFKRSQRLLKVRNQAEQERTKLQHALEIKSKELLAETMKAVSIQQNNDEILQDLKSLIHKLPKQDQNIFTEYIYKLSRRRPPKMLEEFEARFTGVYEDYFARLSKIAPDLTPNELRICAFIRLNITTKDIAGMTGKSTGTIENIRISIRKKLNIDANANLQHYLLGL
jgi:DNA-binding CsgD family transcriptional regulator